MAVARSNFKYLVPIVAFLEDLWFYKYHSTNYTRFMSYFLKEVDIVNYYRLTPDFLNFT